jgi:ATP-dependent DNA helicase RecG
MYTEAQLISLLNAPESHCLERKETFKDKEKICRTICAFANDSMGYSKAGVVWLGVKDNGDVLGIDASDELLQKIDQIKSEGKIQPLPSFSIRPISYEGKTVIAIVVIPSSLPPVSYDGRVWVRMSASTQLASAEDERLLSERRRSTSGRSFDSEAIPQASIQDLNVGYFQNVYLPQAVAPDVLRANGRSLNEQLVGKRMASGSLDVYPTVAGLLTLGLSPQDWLSGAYVQYVRYAGTAHGGSVINEKKVYGYLEDVIKTTEELLQLNIQVSVDITSQTLEKRYPEYPIAALQQLFRNAIMHRNYEGTNTPVRVYWFDDRIEICNPGGPYGTVTQENFGTPLATDYRNPVLAEVMFNLSYAQKFGFGIQNARELLQKNGNGLPVFELQPTLTTVTIYKSKRVTA